MDVPVVELYVKASRIDKRNMGPNTLDQQYFMAFSLLDANRYVTLKEVITINSDNPPDEYIEMNVGSKLPVLHVLTGHDSTGRDLTDTLCSTDDELEDLIARIGCPTVQTARSNPEQANVEKIFLDLVTKFNVFLKRGDPSSLLQKLSLIDGYLSRSDLRYILSDELSFADCMLMPKLHHIRVAGMAYKGLEIPPDFINIWKYLNEAYNSAIFTQSCPADQDIIEHYSTKADHAPLTGDPRTQLQRTFSFDVPPSLQKFSNTNGTNSSGSSPPNDANINNRSP